MLLPRAGGAAPWPSLCSRSFSGQLKALPLILVIFVSVFSLFIWVFVCLLVCLLVGWCWFPRYYFFACLWLFLTKTKILPSPKLTGMSRSKDFQSICKSAQMANCDSSCFTKFYPGVIIILESSLPFCMFFKFHVLTMLNFLYLSFVTFNFEKMTQNCTQFCIVVATLYLQRSINQQLSWPWYMVLAVCGSLQVIDMLI